MTMYMLAVLTRLLLFAPPPPATQRAATEPPAPSAASLEGSDADEMSFYAASQLLVQGVALGDEDPEAAVPVLEQVLSILPEYAPQLAAEADLLELRAHAQVSLARAYLLAGREAKAVIAMDEAIRSALGRPLPTDLYGPAVEALWLERSVHVQQRPGRPVEVRCEVECRVYVNERRVGPEELLGLPVGVYRLWIGSVNHENTIVRRYLSVTRGTTVITVKFGQSNVVRPTRMPQSNHDHMKHKTTSPKREGLSPRAGKKIGTTLMGAGGALVGVGGALVGVSIYQLNNENYWGILTALGGGANALIGFISLGVGGGFYRSAMRRSGKKAQRGPIAPVLVFDRNGGRAGVAMRF